MVEQGKLGLAPESSLILAVFHGQVEGIERLRPSFAGLEGLARAVRQLDFEGSVKIRSTKNGVSSTRK